MECKIFCFYNHKDYEQILKNIPIESSYEIITNDKEMEKILKKNNKIVITLEEYFSDYSKNIFDIYQNSKETIQKYENVYREIKYNEIEIIQGLTHYLMNDIVLFEKVKQILEKKSNVIFIFKKFMFLYFSILEHALKIGYKVSDNENILVIKNGQSRIIKSDDEYEFLEKTNTILKYKNSFALYLKNVSQNDTRSKLILEIKASIKLLPIVLQLISSKFRTSKKQLVEEIFKKIKGKISKLEKSEYGFFLSSDREDAIKPYELLIKKIETKKSFSVFTIDPITSSFLTKQKIAHLDFFEDTYFLANALKNTEEGIKMVNEIIRTSNNNDLTLLYFKNFNHNVLDGIYRSIAINIIMSNLLKKINLKKCVIMNGPMLSKVIASLAKKYQITSFSIEAVLVDNNALSSIVYDADKICIYGEQGKKVLTNFGLDENRIIMTGNPKYDYFKFIDQHVAKKSLCSSLNLNFEKKNIVIAMSRWHKNDEKWISRFIQFCKNNDYEVIIKLHPRYKINSEIIEAEINFINENCKDQNYKFTYDVNMNDLISGADLVISDFSNVAIEAMLLDKLVININFLKEELTDLQNFHEFGAALYAEDYETLENMIIKKFENNYDYEEKRIKGKEKIIELFNYRNDGNATDRIFEILQK